MYVLYCVHIIFKIYIMFLEKKTAKVSKKTSNQMKVDDEVISNNESRYGKFK